MWYISIKLILGCINILNDKKLFIILFKKKGGGGLVDILELGS